MESNEGACSFNRPHYKMMLKEYRKLYNNYSNVNNYWQSFWCHLSEGVTQCGPHPSHPPAEEAEVEPATEECHKDIQSGELHHLLLYLLQTALQRPTRRNVDICSSIEPGDRQFKCDNSR